MTSSLKNTFARLWNETDGAILSAEIVLVGTILVLGTIVGLKSVRDSVVTELADFAQAIANVNQSYCYSGVCGHGAETAGSQFQDTTDFCDTQSNYNTQGSKCVNVCAWAVSEGGY
jgi:hypothetical protein